MKAFRCLLLTFALLVSGGILLVHAQEQESGQKEETPTKLTDQQVDQACAGTEVAYKTDTDKKSHPEPQGPSDQALIVVVRPTMMGNKIQTKMSVDGEFKGVNRGNNYFFFSVPPGEHNFCSRAENRSVVTLNVEAGKTYYLQQKITMGFMKARTHLVQIEEEEGKKALAKTHPSSWTKK